MTSGGTWRSIQRLPEVPRLVPINQAIEAVEAHFRRHLEEDGEQLRGHPGVAQHGMTAFGREPEMVGQRVEAAALGARAARRTRRGSRVQMIGLRRPMPGKSTAEFEIK